MGQSQFTSLGLRKSNGDRAHWSKSIQNRTHPPYQQKSGPIEYKIYNLTHNVHMRKGTHWTATRLEQEVQAIVNRIGPFEDTFRHCGYKWTICTVTGNVIDELA